MVQHIGKSWSSVVFKKALLAASVLAAALTVPANAALVVDGTTIGKSIFVGATGNITVRFDGSDAGYTNELYLVGNPSLIFRNHDAGAYPVGKLVDLGTFAAGTELVFRLHVVTTGNDFYTGGAGINSDSFPHAAASIDGNTTFVGFEDIKRGGDKDYNDLNFSVINTPFAIPEPASWGLLIAGFGMIGGASRIRARQTAPKAA